MSNPSEISTAFLQGKPRTAEFLNSRRRFTRQLGKNSQQENDFISAVEDRNRSLAAFRGITSLNPSPFAASDLQDFKGLVKSDFSRFTNPNIYVKDGIIDNRYQIDSDDFTYRRNDPRSAENPDFGSPADWIYVKQHEKLAGQLSDNPRLRESYFDDKFSSDHHLNAQISQSARRKLDFYDPLDDVYLEANPDEARMIALNLGGFADSLNANPALAEGLTDDPSAAYSAQVRDELAAHTSAEFNSRTGLDEEFFRENPEAAVYLNKHPGLKERFNQNPSQAKDFKQHYAARRDEILTEVTGYAVSSLNGEKGFEQDYLEDNPQFAVDIAADSQLKNRGSLSANILTENSLDDKYAFTGDIYEKHVAARANAALGNIPGINKNFLRNHPRLAFTIQSDPGLSANMNADRSAVNRFYDFQNHSGPNRTNAAGALKSFVSGYPHRDSSFVDLWI